MKPNWKLVITVIVVVGLVVYWFAGTRENLDNPQPPTPPVQESQPSPSTNSNVNTSNFSTSFYSATKKQSNPNAKNQAPIFGPYSGGKNSSSASNSQSKKNLSNGKYPEIFGPDVTVTPLSGSPGTSSSGLSGTTSGLVSSDQVDQPSYEFNPDLKNAFPYDGPPQPFLTDFKKIQH